MPRIKSIDVCIITKNSMKTLPFCLSAIRRHIPVNRIIVVDGYSTDGTIEYVESMECEVYLDKGGRGTARQKCIENVLTEVFAFIDDDVVVHKSWFNEMTHWFNVLMDDVGAITGIPKLYPYSHARQYYKYINELTLSSLKKPVEVSTLHTGSCLLRRHAVAGIKFPKWLQHREDTFLTEYILSKGYTCWRVPVCFKHYAGGSWASLYGENAANQRLLGKWGLKMLTKKTLGSWYLTSKMLLRFGDPRVLPWNLLRQIYTLKGFFLWRDFLHVKS